MLKWSSKRWSQFLTNGKTDFLCSLVSYLLIFPLPFLNLEVTVVWVPWDFFKLQLPRVDIKPTKLSCQHRGYQLIILQKQRKSKTKYGLEERFRTWYTERWENIGLNIKESCVLKKTNFHHFFRLSISSVWNLLSTVIIICTNNVYLQNGNQKKKKNENQSENTYFTILRVLWQLTNWLKLQAKVALWF